MDHNTVVKTLTVAGMTCASCAARIENALKAQAGVFSAAASYDRGALEVSFDPEIISLENISGILAALGYRVSEPAAASRDSSGKISSLQLVGTGVIILALYLAVKNTVGFNFIPQIDPAMGYGLLFVTGLLTSLHCLAMCGGINLSQTMARKNSGAEGNLAQFKPGMLYNGGRVVSYTLIGGLAGALGSAVSFSGPAKGIVAVVSGILMIIMGLNMLDIFPWLKKFNPRLPGFIGRMIYGRSRRNGPFYVGLLNGLMPCGPLQAMQLYALGTGGFIPGAASMFFFSLGTVPLVFGLGVVSTLLSSRFTARMLKASMALVIILGIFMVGRGLNLSGVSFSQAVSAKEAGNIATISDGVQFVTTSMASGTYTPIVVQKGIPLRWTIKAESRDLNGCNNPLTIPQLNKEVKLAPGDNLIEFTPEAEGNLIYTCWMGMISSNIKVVADISQVSAQDIENAAQAPAGVSGSCSCCSIEGGN